MFHVAQGGDVAFGQVHDVNVVAHAGAVFGGVVVAEDVDVCSPADGHLADVGHQVVGNALRVFAKEHHVLVTTHSPMFFGPGATETFVKLRKVKDAAIAPRPFTLVQPVDLSDMTAKDQF